MSEQEIQRYEEMLAQDAKSRAFAPLAEAYRKAGRLDEAIQTAERGLKHHPGYTGGLVVLGRALYEKNELERSSEILMQAVKEAPDNYIAQKFLGKVLFDKGEVQDALSALEAAIMLSPDDHEVADLLERTRKKARKPETMEYRDEEAASSVEVPPPPPPRPVTIDGVELEPLGVEFSGIGDGSDPALMGGEYALPEIIPEQVLDAEEPTRAPAAEPMPEPATEPPPVAFDADIPELEEILSSDEPAAEPMPEPATEPPPVAFEADIPVPEELLSSGEPAAGPMPEPATIGEGGDPPRVDPVPEAGDISTETLGDIYAQQGESEKARQIYANLLAQRPDDADLRRKLAALDGSRATPGAPAAAAPSMDPAEPVDDAARDDAARTLERWLDNARNLRR